ncbi:MAG: phage portal protein [Ruminococcus sp.]|nr:phage portal protein [Ruminococcus sp.]
MGLLDFISSKFNRKGKLYVNTHDSFYSLDNAALAGNETVFAAVSMLANAVASAPVSLRKGYEKVPPGEHNVALMCEFGFNPSMTAFEFMRSMEAQRCAEGAAYALKRYDRDHRMCALYLLKSSEVTPIIERSTNELYYRIYDEAGQHIIHSEHIIETDFISADGYTKGIKPISVLRNALAYDRQVKTFAVDQLQYGIKPNLVITVNEELNEEQLMEYDEMINRFKQHGILYLDPGKSLSEVKQGTVIDPKVFEAEQITVKKVASVFNIPYAKLWGGENYSSAEEADLAYLKDTILPIIRMYEQAFSKGLLTKRERMEGYSIKFNMNGYARANMSARGEFYQKGIRNGWFCDNDIREWEDMTPYEGGDKFYISKDLIEVSLLEPFVLKQIYGGGEGSGNTENYEKGGDKNVRKE